MVAAVLLVAGCSGSATSICETAGGTYTGGACIRWNPALQAAQEWCEREGGVFLSGQDTCAFGRGGQ